MKQGGERLLKGGRWDSRRTTIIADTEFVVTEPVTFLNIANKHSLMVLRPF